MLDVSIESFLAVGSTAFTSLPMFDGITESRDSTVEHPEVSDQVEQNQAPLDTPVETTVPQKTNAPAKVVARGHPVPGGPPPPINANIPDSQPAVPISMSQRSPVMSHLQGTPPMYGHPSMAHGASMHGHPQVPHAYPGAPAHPLHGPPTHSLMHGIMGYAGHPFHHPYGFPGSCVPGLDPQLMMQQQAEIQKALQAMQSSCPTVEDPSLTTSSSKPIGIEGLKVCCGSLSYGCWWKFR